MTRSANGGTWRLPLAGVGNACKVGDAQVLRWAPGGRMLIAGISSARSLSLCLYDLGTPDLTSRAPQTVRVSLVSRLAGLEGGAGRGGGAGGSTGGGGSTSGGGAGDSAGSSSTSSAERLLNDMPGTKDLTSVSAIEYQPSWFVDARKRHFLAFYAGTPGQPSSVYAVADLRVEPERWSWYSTGGSDATRQVFYLEPVWAGGLDDGSSALPARLTLVSNADFSGECGKARLVTFDAPTSQQEIKRGQERLAGFQPLTIPCDGQTSENVSDIDPAWEPTGKKDLLAFVRHDAGRGRSRVCIVMEPRTRGRTVCGLEEWFEADSFLPAGGKGATPGGLRSPQSSQPVGGGPASSPGGPASSQGGAPSQGNTSSPGGGVSSPTSGSGRFVSMDADAQVTRQYPAVAPGGRYVVYYATVVVPKGQAGPTSSSPNDVLNETWLFSIDLSRKDPRAIRILRGVRPDPRQPPALFEVGQGTGAEYYVVAVVRDDEGNYDKVVTVPLEGGAPVEIATGLENIKALDVTQAYDSYLLVLSAQTVGADAGPADETAAHYQGLDKIYVLPFRGSSVQPTGRREGP